MPEFYARVILERKNSLQEVSNVLVADAYFSKRTFVEPLVSEDFSVISRLRSDADLKHLYSGVPKKGRGHPKKYDGKLNIAEPDESKIEKVSELENEKIYSGVIFSKSLKRSIRLVIVKTN